MPEHRVAFVVTTPSPVDDLAKQFYDRFDGIVAERAGQVSMVVYVETTDPVAAARMLITQLETQLGVSVVRVDEDLVDCSEIAERLGVSRQNVHQLARGERGSGFPHPVGSPGGKRIWTWGQVTAWAADNGRLGDEALALTPDEAALVTAYLAQRRRRVMVEVPGSFLIKDAGSEKQQATTGRDYRAERDRLSVLLPC